MLNKKSAGEHGLSLRYLPGRASERAISMMSTREAVGSFSVPGDTEPDLETDTPHLLQLEPADARDLIATVRSTPRAFCFFATSQS
ncbi:hypothetical protein GR197_03515 [Rhizobium phaseoli]|uniref:Uncharacterized protein n=1 Tax=Rhizobium phaseoli TaxID=396 RepID=A0A7K3U8B5_9HYPH|nr:hypothetical protein [Rhizobium phaseoli]